MAITPVVVADDTPVEVRGPASRKVTGEWSPHLWHDRRARARRSIFKAPSIDEEAEGSGLSRRTVQIWLFAGGFIFPLGKCRRAAPVGWCMCLTDREISVDCCLCPATASEADAPRRATSDADALQSRTGSREGHALSRRGALRECEMVAQHQPHHVCPRIVCYRRCSKSPCSFLPYLNRQCSLTFSRSRLLWLLFACGVEVGCDVIPTAAMLVYDTDVCTCLLDCIRCIHSGRLPRALSRHLIMCAMCVLILPSSGGVAL